MKIADMVDEIIVDEMSDRSELQAFVGVPGEEIRATDMVTGEEDDYFDSSSYYFNDDDDNIMNAKLSDTDSADDGDDHGRIDNERGPQQIVDAPRYSKMTGRPMRQAGRGEFK